MPFEISYDPSLINDAGSVKIDKNDLRERDGQTLLYFLFWLLYTKEGRGTMLDKNRTSAGPLTEVEEKAFLGVIESHGIVNRDLQQAILGAHRAGKAWANAYQQGPTSDEERARQEKIYLQNLAFITWSIWEDGKAHEFSLAW